MQVANRTWFAAKEQLMSISGVGSTPSTQTQALSSTTRAPDGDFLAPSAKTTQVKDSDGDYRPVATTSSAVSTSSSNVQAALNSLKTGG